MGNHDSYSDKFKETGGLVHVELFNGGRHSPIAQDRIGYSAVTFP
jgi:hypothetical protein